MRLFARCCGTHNRATVRPGDLVRLCNGWSALALDLL